MHPPVIPSIAIKILVFSPLLQLFCRRVWRAVIVFLLGIVRELPERVVSLCISPCPKFVVLFCGGGVFCVWAAVRHVGEQSTAVRRLTWECVCWSCARVNIHLHFS
jgi:hypothetical protein